MGAGGGYDVLGAVPLFVQLRARGIEVHFASISFASLERLAGAVVDAQASCLFRVDGTAATTAAYCPEAWLSRWLEEAHGYGSPVWALRKVGVRPLRAALALLAERLALDMVVLVDGGIDLCLRGDETSIGTPAEDLVTLGAVAGLGVPALAMCVGFGSELREGIPHAQVLERIAELQRLGAFLGAETLHPGTTAGRAYQDALAFVLAGQAEQRGSHVHRVVAGAMRGEFGGATADVWISPLASLCWYFDVPPMAASHLFLKEIEDTETISDVTLLIRGIRKRLAIREPSAIPI